MASNSTNEKPSQNSGTPNFGAKLRTLQKLIERGHVQSEGTEVLATVLKFRKGGRMTRDSKHATVARGR